jgi:hypothetical protein
MVVSQHLVSWIQVAGLILGLYGFFFLSISLFGNKNARWFSALLPASGLGLSGLLVATGFPGLPLVVSDLVVVITGVGFFVAGYWLGVDSWRRWDSEVSAEQMIRARNLLLILWPLMAVVLVAVVAFNAIVLQSSSVFIDYQIRFVVGFVLLVGTVTLLLSLPKSLGAGRLLGLGFILSLFAILTQFIPPVLDLLSITIR